MTKEIKQKQRLGVAYIRESTKEQDKGYSPETQEQKIKDYAEDHNIKIVETYKDLISGKLAVKRDDFQQMMNGAMQKKFEIILVYHSSRFARNVKEARHYKELLREKLNIDVVSVTQKFGDWNRPDAYLNEGINELFDAYYSKQLSFWLKGSLMQKRLEGKELGNPPLGYYKKRLVLTKQRIVRFMIRSGECTKRRLKLLNQFLKCMQQVNILILMLQSI